MPSCRLRQLQGVGRPAAEDLEAAKEFYERALALPVRFEDADPAVFKFGGTLITR